jgi:hypothetical protein
MINYLSINIVNSLIYYQLTIQLNKTKDDPIFRMRSMRNVSKIAGSHCFRCNLLGTNCKQCGDFSQFERSDVT